MSERIDEILEYVYKSDKPVFIKGMLEDLQLSDDGLMNRGLFFLWKARLVKLDRTKKFASLTKIARDTMSNQKVSK